MKFSKLFLLSIFTILSVISCKRTVSEGIVNSNNTERSSEIAKAVFDIEGMSCAVMCASKIQETIKKQSGVFEVNVDFESKKATFSFDPTKISANKIKDEIENLLDGKTYKVGSMVVDVVNKINTKDNKEQKPCCSTQDKKPCCTDKAITAK